MGLVRRGDSRFEVFDDSQANLGVGSIYEAINVIDSRTDTIETHISNILNRVSIVENTTAVGSIKGAFNTVSELDTLIESDIQEGWMYGIRSTNDIYVYVALGNNFDYKPNGWIGGFVQFGNTSDINGAISNEANLRLQADNVLNNIKVDKVVGKGLSTEDYTTSDKNKLSNIDAGFFAGYSSNVVGMSATQSVSSTTIVNITELFFNMLPNTAYYVDAFITFTSKSTTTGIGLGFTSPIGANCMVEVVVPTASNATASALRVIFPSATFTNTGLVQGTGVSAINSNHTARISGIILNGNSAGNFQLQFKSETNNMITIQTNSTLTYGRIQ